MAPFRGKIHIVLLVDNSLDIMATFLLTNMHNCQIPEQAGS